jgi:hypothetical protein
MILLTNTKESKVPIGTKCHFKDSLFPNCNKGFQEWIIPNKA